MSRACPKLIHVSDLKPIHTHVYTHLHTHMYTHTHTYMYTHAHTHTHTQVESAKIELTLDTFHNFSFLKHVESVSSVNSFQ